MRGMGENHHLYMGQKKHTVGEPEGKELDGKDLINREGPWRGPKGNHKPRTGETSAFARENEHI